MTTTQSIIRTTSLLFNHTTRRIVTAAAFFSCCRAFSQSSLSFSSVFARSNDRHSSCRRHHRWSFLSSNRGGSNSVALPTLSSSSSLSSSTVSSTISTTVTPMDQVRASAAAKTAAEKLFAMRKKMEEYGVDGECSFDSSFRIPPHPFKIHCFNHS